MFADFFKNKKFFITGHTGFKGSWLTLWLKMLGADICGFSLDPPSQPNLFETVRADDGIKSIHGDIRDFTFLKKAICDFQPDIVFHMAAQSLVRKSYEDPIETYSSNVMGTVHLLEAVRLAGRIKGVINVTSDKCYENREWMQGYRETDPMGGADPYSSSKGCAELVSSAYLQSFFNPDEYSRHGIALATTRAGNVIGGGDFACDRLVPDLVRSIANDAVLKIRFPHACRPWQHVLEPLSGYMKLAKALYEKGPDYCGGWNFGPDDGCVVEVCQIADKFMGFWGCGNRWCIDGIAHPHEAKCLKLDSSKSRTQLTWKPRLNIDLALEWTVNWYKAYYGSSNDMRRFTEDQIAEYEGIGLIGY